MIYLIVTLVVMIIFQIITLMWLFWLDCEFKLQRQLLTSFPYITPDPDTYVHPMKDEPGRFA